jgi:hypothetical protein
MCVLTLQHLAVADACKQHAPTLHTLTCSAHKPFSCAMQPQATGTGCITYQKTPETESESTTRGGHSTTVQYTSITAMPPYASKSVEELRFEDHAAGVKGNNAFNPAAASTGSGAAATHTMNQGGFFGHSSNMFGAPSQVCLQGIHTTPSGW